MFEALSPTLGVRILTEKLQLTNHAACSGLPSNYSDIPFTVVKNRFTVHIPRVHGPHVNGLAGNVVLLWSCARVSDFWFLHMQPRESRGSLSDVTFVSVVVYRCRINIRCFSWPLLYSVGDGFSVVSTEGLSSVPAKYTAYIDRQLQDKHDSPPDLFLRSDERRKNNHGEQFLKAATSVNMTNLKQALYIVINVHVGYNVMPRETKG